MTRYIINETSSIVRSTVKKQLKNIRDMLDDGMDKINMKVRIRSFSFNFRNHALKNKVHLPYRHI